MASEGHGPRATGEAILFIRGKRQAARLWAPQIEILAATHRVVALDVEGDDPVAEARRLLDDLAIPSVNVVACGDDGLIALDLAAAHPQRVRRVAFVDFEPPENTRLLCPVLRTRADGGPEAINGALAGFLGQRLSRFDNRELRSAFGSFITGVTIVTTAGVDGQPRGFTANSFTSVSLEPPLLLICVGKAAASVDVFRHAAGFAVNILSEEQKDTSVLFASKRPDKFEAARWRPGPFGNPLIEGSAAWFDCARYQVIDAGDHIILMGHVEAFAYTDANPLGYARGHYITLGLEQAAVNAASSASRTVVGAILESDGRLVLLPDPARPDGLILPEAGRTGPNGSASQLHHLLVREGMDATLGFLFAVFENPETREQCIYYRGEALLHARGRTVLADFEDIPWDRLPDEATRSMLRRFAAERKIGRFKVYSGDHRQGTVKAVD
ncbi:MAG: flavin reductase [Aestuariivirga sp.]|uniref:flavin reductase n=1 Tax=Aestuariivirga sp. TaxID=2650926 RepID=UPI0038CFB6DC